MEAVNSHWPLYDHTERCPKYGGLTSTTPG